MSTVKHTIEPNRHLNPPPPPTTPYPHNKSPDLHDSEKSPLKVQGGPDPRTPRPATGLELNRAGSGAGTEPESGAELSRIRS